MKAIFNEVIVQGDKAEGVTGNREGGGDDMCDFA